MKNDRFWKLAALTALGLLAVAVFRGMGTGGAAGPGLLASTAQANVALDEQYAYTTAPDGRVLYVWNINTGREPVVQWTGRAD